ncbi:MAG: hypothetical protein ACE5IG_02605 [Dehalococcoidia bacterium]
MIRRLRISGLVLVALLVSMLGTSAVHGQGGIAIRISPPNFELEADPGQVVAQQIRVTNRGEAPIPITMEVAGFTPTGQEGQVALTEDEEVRGIVTWLTVSPRSFVLEPDQEQQVTFVIEVPLDAEPGGHYASILASVGATTQAGAVAVGQRVGSLVLLRVSGEVIEQARVTSFSVPGLSAKGPIPLDILVENTGNVHVRPAGEIIVKGTFGGEVARIPVEQKAVLPGSPRTFSVTWDTGWKIGRYTAEYIGFYGSSNQQFVGTASFVIFPWPIALPILGVLALLAFGIVRGRQRLARAVRILSGRE